MEKNNETTQKNYATVSSKDGQRRIWIPRPGKDNTLCCTCSFGMKNHLPFADAIGRLGYARVEAVEQMDEELSAIRIRLTGGKGSLPRLLEDLPELMEEYL